MIDKIESQGRDTMSDQTTLARIFEYLLAVKNLNEKIPRSISVYEKVWWQKDLPNRQGCFLYGTGTIAAAWLEVQKQEIPAAPKPPALLSEWIEDWDDPTKLPKRVSQTV